MRTTKDFVCDLLRLYNGTSNYIDRLCENFDIDTDSDVVYNVLSQCNECGAYDNFGNGLISACFDLIIDKAVQEYPKYANDLPDLFDTYPDDYASDIVFNKETVHTWKELQEEIEAWKELQQHM